MSTELKRLSGPQLKTLLEYAQTMQQRGRSEFLQAVAVALADVEVLDDGVICRTVRPSGGCTRIERCNYENEKITPWGGVEKTPKRFVAYTAHPLRAQGQQNKGT
jgi:hypothetical protein